jgi:hypothetical protein
MSDEWDLEFRDLFYRRSQISLPLSLLISVLIPGIEWQTLKYSQRVDLEQVYFNTSSKMLALNTSAMQKFMQENGFTTRKTTMKRNLFTTRFESGLPNEEAIESNNFDTSNENSVCHEDHFSECCQHHLAVLGLLITMAALTLILFVLSWWINNVKKAKNYDKWMALGLFITAILGVAASIVWGVAMKRPFCRNINDDPSFIKEEETSLDIGFAFLILTTVTLFWSGSYFLMGKYEKNSEKGGLQFVTQNPVYKNPIPEAAHIGTNLTRPEYSARLTF